MPFLKLNTNITLTAEQTPRLSQELSQLLSKETGKPERYVMIELVGGCSMLFAGNAEPLAYMECKSIGLSAKQAGSLSSAITQCVHERLMIAPDRVYIEFSHCAPEFWGWNGTTFG